MASPTTNNPAAASPAGNINEGVFQHLLVPFVLQDPDAGDTPLFDSVDDLAATKQKVQARLQSLNFTEAVINNVLNGPLFAPASSATLLKSMQSMSGVSLYNYYGVQGCVELLKNLVAYCLAQEKELPNPLTQNTGGNASSTAAATQGS
jgi:hypothetical protein